MSARRNQNRSTANSEVEAHNVLEGDSDVNDPVIGAIRFGMDSVMKIANETVPYCSIEEAGGDDLKKEICSRLESVLLQMVESELTFAQTSDMLEECMEELNLQDNPDMDAKEFVEAVDSIPELTNRKLAAYKANLTEETLKSHQYYQTFKRELERLMDEEDEPEEVDTADAETEAEEMDESVEDADPQEIIPELDPISKKPLTDPCRNRICRHIYGKASMLEMLKSNPKIRCTAMGCSNRAFVRADDLIDDPILTAKVTGQPIPSTSRAGKSPRSSSQTTTPAKKSRSSGRGRRRR